MSTSYNVYLGWFARFTPETLGIVKGTKKIRRCPTNSKHPSSSPFCPQCGEAILIEDRFSHEFVSHVSNLTCCVDAAELKEETLGRAQPGDLRMLQQSHGINDMSGAHPQQIVFAPGYKQISDLTRSNTGYLVYDQTKNQVPPKEWLDMLHRIYLPHTFTLCFGAAVEIT